jgi:hypothetical protein
MTPKEKAEEILEKMQDKASEHDCFGSEYLVAKECALIAVDEIINASPTQPNAFLNVVKSSINYWEEVKQEMQTL